MSALRRALLSAIAGMLVSAFYDNARGPLLPLIALRDGLDHARTAVFVSAGSLSSFLLCLASVRLLERMDLPSYVRLSLAIQVLGVAGVAYGGGYAVLIVSGLFWGAGLAGIGMSTSLLAVAGADERARTRRLGLTHACYGVGSALAGFYVAHAVLRGWSVERTLLLTLPLVAFLFVGVGVLGAGGGRDAAAEGISWRRMLSPRELAGNIGLSFYVLGEVLTSMWLTSFLVGEAGMPLPRASLYLTGFFLALSAGRVAGAFLIPLPLEKRLPPVCLVAGGASLLAGINGAYWGFLAGAFVMGPFFPLAVAAFAREHPRTFPSFLAFCLATMTVALTLGHLAMGALCDAVSLRAAFCLPPACLGAALGLHFLALRWAQSVQT